MDKRIIEKKRKALRDLYGEQQEIIEGIENELSTPEEKEKLHRSLEIIEKKIEAQKEDIKQFTEDTKEYSKLQRKLTVEDEKKLIDQVINDYDVSYNPLLGKFIYCKDYSSNLSNKHCNPQFQMFESTKINNMLRQWTKQSFVMDTQDIIQYFQEIGSSHEMNVFTFHSDNWNKNDVYNRAKILKNKYWIKPDYDMTGFNKEVFEDLFYCVCGGKEENIKHLKIWIAYKYLFPERNSSIPNIDLGGHPGGNGKNTLIILLKTIFLRSTVKATTKDELLKFNGPWEDAVILHYDEPEENELPGSKLKNATGTDEQRIEKKGFDAYQADRNYNFIFTSNNPKGCIKLEGGGKGASDRRYSVITTDHVMRMYFKQKYNMTDLQAGEYINIILDSVRDRVQASKLLGSIITEFDIINMQELDALHGEDYLKRFEDQKSNLDVIFDEIMKILDVTKVIPIEFVGQIIHALSPDGTKKMDNRRLKSRLQGYVHSNGLKDRIVFKERYHLRILYDGMLVDPNTDNIQATCMILDDGANSFEFSEISKSHYRKKIPISKEDCKVSVS